MLEKYRDVFKDVLEMTKKRHDIYLNDTKKYPSGLIDLGDIQECPEYDEMDRKLNEYLNTLDYEVIKVLQTIMYLGRDQDYDRKLTGEDIYISERGYMDNYIGWHTKERDIYQMTEKEPLDQYLKDGLEIIGFIHPAI